MSACLNTFYGDARRRASFVLVVLGVLGTTPLLAQERLPDQSQSNDRLFLEGVHSFEEGSYEAASSYLAALVKRDAGFYRPDRGSAAFWWGRALVEAGEVERAHRAWSAGLGALGKIGFVDPRLSDAYIESVFRENRTAEYARAADAYLRLLERISEFTHPEERCIAIRHIAHILPLLTRAEKARVVERSPSENCEGWQLRDGVGAFLLAWWYAQDPLLETERNERLEIHLLRVFHALRHLTHEGRVSRMDDRGMIFVRFGAPVRTRLLRQFDNPLARRADVSAHIDDWSGSSSPARTADPRGATVVVLPAGLPRGEVWMYDHIHQSGYYIFIKEGRHYRQGQLTELVPAHLRASIGHRGGRYAGVTTNMLFGNRFDLGVYEQLYYEHPDFATALTRFEAAQARTSAGSGDFRTLWTELRADEDLAAAERDRNMPDHYSHLSENVDPLPVQVRAARFLDNDGTTRTEVYWRVDPLEHARGRSASQPAAAEGAPGSRTHLQLAIVQRSADHRRRTFSESGYEFSTGHGERGLSIPTQTTIVRGDTGLYHLALQWEQHAVQTGSEGAGVAIASPHRRTAKTSLDSLRALVAAVDVLEMSDLVPISAPQTLSTLPADERPGDFRPAPSQLISARDSLALYFELYHLTPDENGQRAYTVAYEISRRGSAGPLGLRRQREVLTAASTSYTSVGATARNTILLDLDDRSAGELEVTVRVTDRATRQQVARSISFELEK